MVTKNKQIFDTDYELKANKKIAFTSAFKNYIYLYKYYCEYHTSKKQ